jgi:hypothetical protein
MLVPTSLFLITSCSTSYISSDAFWFACPTAHMYVCMYVSSHLAALRTSLPTLCGLLVQLHACMHVCMHACMHACMYVCFWTSVSSQKPYIDILPQVKNPEHLGFNLFISLSHNLFIHNLSIKIHQMQTQILTERKSHEHPCVCVCVCVHVSLPNQGSQGRERDMQIKEGRETCKSRKGERHANQICMSLSLF